MLRPLTIAAILALSLAAHAEPALEPGLTLRIYDVGRPMDRLHPLRPDQTPNLDRRIDTLDLDDNDLTAGPPPAPGDYLRIIALGHLDIPATGRYAFRLSSDDGSTLAINDQLIINHDGLHAADSREASIHLEKGLHPFRIDMFENTGAAALRLEWRPPAADDFTIIPANAFRTEKGVTRVTSPGRKAILDGRENLRPGDGMPLEDVHPMWTVETVRPESVQHRIGGMDFLPNGSLVYSEFIPVNNGILRERTNGSVWILPGVAGGTGRADAMPVKIADGFHDPAGLAVVDTDIYISHRPGIERLRDTDADGTYETRETFATPWQGTNYHHFSFGLQHHTDAQGQWLYGTLSTSIYFDSTLDEDPVNEPMIGMNGPNPPHRGTAYRINLESREIQWLAGGFRTPNGVHVDSRGNLFVTDNQGAWMPANRLNHIPANSARFFGHYNGLQTSRLFPSGGTPSLNMQNGEWPPAVWLPQNDISNSPTTPLEITDGPFAGQYWLAELTAGGIRRVFLEQVNGELQGAVFRHTQGLESGVNRLIKGPDGCLYIGGTGADGNWNWRGTQFGLQRLRPTGKTAFEIHSMSATPDGFLLRFTRTLPRDILADPDNYTVRQWHYLATPDYGGPMLDTEQLRVTAATPGRSQDAVRLTIPGLRPGAVVHLRTDPASTAGERIWSTEAWYTLNQIPAAGPTPAEQRLQAALDRDLSDLNVLLFSKTAGFRHDSIPAGIACFTELASEHGFTVHATENAADFNDDTLADYHAVVFLNTTGDVLNDSQQAAFERWYRQGRGFLGVHSAADTEYDWPWYARLVGAQFKSHPHIQPARIIIHSREHPATAHLGGFPHFNTWTRTDEWYDFRAQPAPEVARLLSLDGATYRGGSVADDNSPTRQHPIAWHREFDNGRTFYTGGGHTIESYSEPDFRQHLLGALLWTANRAD